MAPASDGGARFQVRRVGGIEETEVRLSPGVTALVGPNATNRTSFLQSIMAVCGSTVPVKGDAEEGQVRLDLAGRTHERTLHRHGRTVSASGDPLLETPRTAELFAFLLEANPVRQAVRRGEPLRELILEPIDTESIEEEIDRLQSKQAEIRAELESIADLESRLPNLQERRERLDDDIEDTRRELDAARERMNELEETVEGDAAGQSELDATLEELNAKQRNLERVRSDVDIEESAIEEIAAEIESLESELEELSEAPEETIDELDRQIEFVREQKRDAEASVNDLQRIIQFNEEMLDGANIDLFEDDVSDRDAVTDRLVENQRVVCWTCGSTVLTDAVEETLDRLRRARREELTKANRLEDRLDELEAERDRLDEQRQRRQSVEEALESRREELQESRERKRRLRSEADDLSEQIAELEQVVERLQDRTYGELLDVQETVNELEFDLEDLRAERADVVEEIETIETRRQDRDDLEERREAIQDAIVEQRTRIERTEEEVVSQFNAQMDDLLELLEYDNVERIWLEPRDSGEKTEHRIFELHVVRTTESGVTYEDAVEHLSESEREVTGIVLALAGYLAHDVYEDVPFLLFDSLESVDSRRIARLVEYVEDYAEYVVLALLPEDARALDDDHDRVTDLGTD